MTENGSIKVYYLNGRNNCLCTDLKIQHARINKVTRTGEAPLPHTSASKGSATCHTRKEAGYS